MTSSGLDATVGSATIEASTIANNAAYGIRTGGDLTISRTRVNGNPSGGIVATAPHTFDVTNSIITGNGNASNVGGIEVDVTNAPGARLEFNTIVGNNSSGSLHGGGVACSGSLAAKYNAIAANKINNSATLSFSQTAGCDFSASTVQNDLGGLGMDPTTFHLSPPSGLIDQVPSSDLPIDFDGDPRPSGSASDIGADEYRP